MINNSIVTMGPSPFITGFELQDMTLENGVKLRVAIGGQGAPLVLLHGHPQNHVTWRKISPILARQFTVIAPDLRVLVTVTNRQATPNIAITPKR